MANSNYNPDVLNCIANLSNDEVFTPPELANRVLDLLPQDLFKSPDSKFLDPFTKSGVFLREIVKRLDRGLESRIPDRQTRVDHILHNQVFGIAITELTSYLARRSVYCSKKANGEYSVSRFNSECGNILYSNRFHTWENGKCKYCGASQSVYDRGSEAEQYAYMFIHTDNPKQFFGDMKFDVIIGNPPYQLNDGGGAGSSAMPLYHKFIQQAKRLKPRYLTMIIPARWYTGGKGLDEFRDEMLKDNSIRVLVDFFDSRDCFPGVDIAGGVCFFLWDRDYQGKCCVINNINDNAQFESIRYLNEFDVFIRDTRVLNIINKVLALKEKTMDRIVFSRNPFGFSSSYLFSHIQPFEDSVKIMTSKGEYYVPFNDISVNTCLINDWKVVMSKTSAEHAGQSDKEGRKTACVSCQVGCGMKCAFCQTGQLGFSRNLTANEIVEQFLYLEEECGHLDNIVFMGMGEPMLNLPEIRKAISVLTDERGRNLSARRITLSTSGIIKGIYDLADNGPNIRLAVSLTTADEDLRNSLMPVNNANPLPELRKAIDYYANKSGKRVTLEAALLKNKNTGKESADRIIAFAKGIDVNINLIPWNPVETLPFEEPDSSEVRNFVSFLEKAGLNVTLRTKRGRKIGGACGQLGKSSASQQ